jgi:digeranylgeranylglycerophospholipid reductase
MNYDVIVVGAGPAGSAAARQVAGQGWSVALLERAAHPGEHAVCGGMLTLARVEEHGVLAAVEKVMQREDHVLPWGTIENTTTQCTVQRRVFDRMLAERATEAGAQLITHTAARAIRILSPGHVEVDTQCRAPDGGHATTLSARALIVADGPQTLARSLGIGYRPSDRGTAFALTYEVAWPGNDMEHYEMYYGDCIPRWGYAWIFPYRETLNIGVGCIRSELRRRDLKQDLSDFIHRHPHASKLLRDKPIVRRRGAWIPMRAARRIVAPSTLVVGDAAGLVHSFLGAGMDNALASGSLAGQVMSTGLATGDLSVGSLMDYAHRWRQTPAAHFMRIQDWIVRAGQMAMGIDRNVPAKIMQLALLGGSLTWPGKFQALGYPWLGTPQRSGKLRQPDLVG